MYRQPAFRKVRFTLTRRHFEKLCEFKYFPYQMSQRYEQPENTHGNEKALRNRVVFIPLGSPKISSGTLYNYGRTCTATVKIVSHGENDVVKRATKL